MTIYYMHGAANGAKEPTHLSSSSELAKWKKSMMASCFDFRARTNSLDLHLAQSLKLAKLGRLFRSKSESEVKSLPTSPKASPKPSPGAHPRRRLVRVVRDNQCEGEEFENPHIVRKYSKKYWENLNLQKSQSLDMDKPLPYTVSGHTILKKHGSIDSAGSDGGSPPCHKHAMFKEDVQIIEFDKKEKIKKKVFCMHEGKLQDDSSEETGSDPDFERFKHRIKGKKVPPMEYSSEEESESGSLAEAVITGVGEISMTEAQKEQLTLRLLAAGQDTNGLCSPVKEEDETDEVSDTSSVVSDLSLDQPLDKKHCTEEAILPAVVVPPAPEEKPHQSIASKIMSAHKHLHLHKKPHHEVES